MYHTLYITLHIICNPPKDAGLHAFYLSHCRWLMCIYVTVCFFLLMNLCWFKVIVNVSSIVYELVLIVV